MSGARAEATEGVADRGMAVGTPRQFGWLNAIVKAVLVLNLADAIFSLIWVGGGLATEANALLAGLVERQPVVFVSVKLALASLGSVLLWRFRRRPVAVVGIFAVFLVYYWILVYHLSYLSTLFASL